MAAPVPIEEYLRTSYPDGDLEYVDGRLTERNIGRVDHAECQTGAAVFLSRYRELWTAVSVRVRVSDTRVRVPDVTSVKGPRPRGDVVAEPSFLVVEVLSPDDCFGDFQEKIDDYVAFGIPYVWVVNPGTRRGYIYTTEGMREAKDGVMRTRNPDIALPLDSI